MRESEAYFLSNLFKVELMDYYIKYSYKEKLSDGRTMEFIANRVLSELGDISTYHICLTIEKKRKNWHRVHEYKEVTGVGIEGLTVAKTTLELFEESVKECMSSSEKHIIRVGWADKRRKRVYTKLIKNGYVKNREQEFFEKTIVPYQRY